MKNKERLIAYLILTHGNAEVTQKFIESVQTKQAHFFIHVDKKATISQFNKLNSNNVTFLKKRYDVTWKGFSQVRAEAELLKTAVKSEYSFKYYSLHSGVDTNLQKSKNIESFLSKSSKNYINFREFTPNSSYIKYFKNEELWMKISKWHFYDQLKINWRPSSNKWRLFLYRTYVLFNILIVNLFFPKKEIPKNVRFYFGDAWWTITDKTAKYIVKKWDEKYLHKEFMYTDCPDEMYFQTVILNSPHKKDTLNNFKRYINWDKTREMPAILDERDISVIQKQKPLFGRKADLTKSKSLMEKLKLW